MDFEEQILYVHHFEGRIEKIEKIEVKCNNCGECCKKASPFGSPCKYLTKENLCSIYEKRPFECRAYPVNADLSFDLCEPYNKAKIYFHEKYDKDGIVAYLNNSPHKIWK